MLLLFLLFELWLAYLEAITILYSMCVTALIYCKAGTDKQSIADAGSLACWKQAISMFKMDH